MQSDSQYLPNSKDKFAAFKYKQTMPILEALYLNGVLF